jgi:hypothetical protein
MPAHYIPKARFRTEDASKHAQSLFDALRPWIEQAMVGEKRHRIASVNTPAVSRAADDLYCDCAQVLAACPDWEGALLAHHFAERGWPVDVELVRICHTWSTGLMDRVMNAYRHRGASLNPAHT